MIDRNRNVSLKVLVVNDGGFWLAHAVDYDIVAQAATLDDLAYEFNRMVVVHIAACIEHNLAPFESLPPAPEEIRKAFNEAVELDMRFPRFRTANPPPPSDARLYSYAG